MTRQSIILMRSNLLENKTLLSFLEKHSNDSNNKSFFHSLCYTWKLFKLKANMAIYVIPECNRQGQLLYFSMTNI